MPAKRKKSSSEEPTLVPEAVDWSGPVSRVVCCSDDTEKTMRPPNPFFLHAIEPTAIWTYTISGYVEYEEAGRMTRVGPGTALACLLPGRGTLVYKKGGLPWRRIYIGFKGDAALEIFRHVVRRYGNLHELPVGSDTIKFARRFCKLVETQPLRSPQFWSAEAYRWLNTWWEDCRNHSLKVRDPARDDQDMPAENFRSVKDLAMKMGYSRSHLSRRLKKIWNRDPSQVMRQRRFEEARRLLRETSLPVTEVAGKSGFGSSSAFCAAFKGSYGQTPLQYRRERTTI